MTVKLRLPSFSTLTRSKTLPDPTDAAADLFHVAGELYENLPAGRRRFRLLGVAATGLVPAGAEQISLVKPGRWDDAERAVDRVRAPFRAGNRHSGRPVATRAAELHPPPAAAENRG